MDNVVERIKKLLALGQANSGATEHEAATAMSMAAALMAKHGIDVQLDDETRPEAVQGDMFTLKDDWELQCAQAAGFLYSCRVIRWKRIDRAAFVARPDNISAAVMTYLYLTREVERLYKMHLPKGLDQSDRAEFRRTFKFACGRRLAARAWAIMEELRQDDVKALAATGSRALVIVQSVDAQLAEADAILKNMGCREVTARPRSAGSGTLAGRQAGDTVQLQAQVGK